MKYIGQVRISNREFQVYRNSEGFLELFRSKGNVVREGRAVFADHIDRFVTNVTTTEELVGWFRKKKRKPFYDPYKDENQLKIT